MIRLTIREAAAKEGITSPRELERATGLSYATCHAVWNSEPQMVQLETLELICTLLGVRPGQLFEFESDSEKLQRRTQSKNRSVKAASKKGKAK